MNIPDIKHLTNDELKIRVEELRHKECEVISDLVLHLSELDSRGYYRDLGYSSLFSYLTQGLGYSEGAAQRRVQAARCLKANPEVYFKLREGKLSLCTVSEIAKAPAEMKSTLLLEAQGRSKRDVERMVASVLPAVASKRESVRVKQVVILPPPVAVMLTPDNSPPPVAVEERYTLTLEVDKEFMQLLEQARAVSGRVRNSEVIKKALNGYVSKKSPVKRQLRRDSKPNQIRSRHIPHALRDRVLLRDGCRCTFVSPDGVRCSETCGLEIDHCKPFALGGATEESNLRALCRAHNQLMAERQFGPEFIQKIASSHQS